MSTRRDFLAFTSGAAVAVMPMARTEGMAITATPSHPDAKLLATCAAFDRLQHVFTAIGGSHPPGSAEEDAANAQRRRIGDEQEPLIASMHAHRAVTLEGQVARARSFTAWNYELIKPDPHDVVAVFTAAIVRDLLSGSAGGRCGGVLHTPTARKAAS